MVAYATVRIMIAAIFEVYYPGESNIKAYETTLLAPHSHSIA